MEQLAGRKNHNKVNIIKIVRKIAVDTFPFTCGFEEFAHQLWNHLGHRLIDEHSDLTYHNLYKKFVIKLQEKSDKASYINKNYIPLESDLFEI